MKYIALSHKKTISEKAGLIAVLGFAALLLPVILLQPLAPDQATYQSMALELVHRGQLPYVGSWDLNFPGIVYIHALGILLFGNSDVAFRVIDLSSIFIATLLLYRLATRWTSPLAAVLTCLLYLLQYTVKSNWTIGQRDAFATMLVLASTVALLKSADMLVSGKHRGKLVIVIAGLVMSGAIMIRPNYILFAAAALLFLLRRLRKGFISPSLSYLLGCLFLPALFIAWYSTIPGALNDAYLATIRMNLDVYGGRTMNRFALARTGLHAGLIVAIFYFWKRTRHLQIPGYARNLRINSDELELLEMYVIASSLSVMAMGKYFIYQYEPLWPFVCVIGGFLSAQILERAPRLSSLGIALTLLIWFFFEYPWRIERTFILTGFKTNWTHAYDSAAYGQADFLQDEVALRDRIQRTTRPTDIIEVCAMNAGARWRVDHPLASRFTTVYPITLSAQGRYTEYQKRWREEFVEAIKVKRPKYLVLDRPPGPNEPRWISVFTPGYRDLPSNIPALQQLLDRNYVLDTILATYVSYRLRTP